MIMITLIKCDDLKWWYLFEIKNDDIFLKISLYVNPYVNP